MKRLRFLPALLAVLSACSENLIEQGSQYSDEMGSVSISLSTDMRSGIVTTKAENEPDIDGFTVEIYKTDAKKTRLYNDSFANTAGKTIHLNAGEYRLVAQHGDTLGCGFDKPYYLADVKFEVKGPGQELNATATLGNTKIAVEYDRTISGVYADYKTVVKHNSIAGKSVVFEKGETRSGYIPSGELILEIWADGKVYRTAPSTWAPNDFVTFTVASSDADGDLSISITNAADPDPDNKEILIPVYAEPQGPPTYVVTGFDNNVHQYIEGVPSGNDCKVTFVARAGVKNCFLTTISSCLTGKGFPSSIDFANLTEQQEAKLKSFGFSWSPNIKDSRTFNIVDFAGVISYLNENSGATDEDYTAAEFKLKIVDNEKIDDANQPAEVTLKVVSSGITTTVSVEDYNVWAAKIVEPEITLSKGDMSLLKLQISSDTMPWTDVAAVPEKEGYKLTYEKVQVEPGTTYYLRSIYNNNPAISATKAVTTEKALQLGNSGFEDYQLVRTEFKPTWAGDFTRNWYLPYKQGETDPWWACNSLKSMPEGVTAGYNTKKNFPSSGYVKDARTGSKAAMLFCVHVGNSNNDSNYTNGLGDGALYNGEIWIGSSDDEGNQTNPGHAFASRPSKLSFWYKYAPTGGKNFYVETWVKDAAGNVIATSRETAGQAASVWTKFELPFNYTVTDAKAASIYVWIASANGTGSVDAGVTFDLGEESVNAHAGCFLKIDDMELIYE